MSDLDLTLACWNYDRTAALADGSVKPEGVRLRYLQTFPAETFQRMVKFREFDVSEIGFKFYVSSLAMKEPPFIAIPVFPLRIFRHSSIFINTRSGIEKPADLIGRKVGEPFAYGHDAAIWARGALADDYGVAPTDSTFYVGAVDHAVKRDFAPFPPRGDIRVVNLEGEQTLDGMLEAGDIDAMYTALTPPSFLRGSPNVRRLFVDYESVERDYFRRTRIFPIMHLIAIRRELYEKHRWLAQSLFRAFNEAKFRALDNYRHWEQYCNAHMAVPWITSHLEQNRALMGDDPWPYGFEANRAAIDAFLRYHHEQGLSEKPLKAEDLFAPETLVEYSRFA
jgi:4,5-dihydroxyphthalate decarboxylase